jgi:WD40 repeat protein
MIQEHGNFVNCVKYSPSGEFFVSGGADGKVRESESSGFHTCTGLISLIQHGYLGYYLVQEIRTILQYIISIILVSFVFHNVAGLI